MKFSSMFFTGVLVIAGATAQAATVLGSLSVSGVNDTFTNSSISFNGNSYVGLGTGDFSYLTGTTATLNNFSFDSSAIGETLLTASDTSFVITQAPVLKNYTSDFLNVTGTGYFTTAGVQVGDWGTFHITSTNNSIDGQGITSFTLDGTAAEAPEPSSMALLGTGLLGTAAVVRRRLVVS